MRVQLVGIVLSIVLCLAVREQQQQQQQQQRQQQQQLQQQQLLLGEDGREKIAGDVDSAMLDKHDGHRPALDDAKLAQQ